MLKRTKFVSSFTNCSILIDFCYCVNVQTSGQSCIQLTTANRSNKKDEFVASRLSCPSTLDLSWTALKTKVDSFWNNLTSIFENWFFGCSTIFNLISSFGFVFIRCAPVWFIFPTIPQSILVLWFFRFFFSILLLKYFFAHLPLNRSSNAQ